MLRAKQLSWIASSDITSILPIAEASRVLAANQAGHVLVYSYEGQSLRLTQTYNHLMKNNGTDTTIYRMLYSHQLATVFAVCAKSIVLLNSANLNQFDKIVEKRGIEEAWVFEQPCSTHGSMTALLFYPQKAGKLKLFLWNGRTFKSVSELNLSSKGEEILSMEMERTGFILVTNIGYYYWNLNDLSLQRLTKVTAPVWPRTIYDALKELEESSSSEKSSQNEVSSMSSMSSLSQKVRYGHLFQRRETRGGLRKKKLLFRPAAHEPIVLLDGQTRKKLEISVGSSQVSRVSASNWDLFFDANDQFDDIQYLSSNFLLLHNNNSIRIVEFQYGFSFLDLNIKEGIKKVFKAQNSNLLVWTCANTLQLYKLIIRDDHSTFSTVEDDFSAVEEGTAIRTLKAITFYQAILSHKNKLSLCESFGCDSYEQTLDIYALKLRDLTVLWSFACFDRCQQWFEHAQNTSKNVKRALGLQELIIKGVFDNLIDFLAPPELVIGHCFPRFVAKLLDDGISGELNARQRLHASNISGRIMNKWCLPYLTDIRRNLHNLAKKGTIQWSYEERAINVDLQFFLVNHHQERSIGSLLKLVDTCIFKVYLEFNPAMLDPFTGVQNDCDFETVVEELSKNMKIQELVNFYFMRGKHDMALKLLTDLGSNVKSAHPKIIATNIKMLVVDYLKKLPQSALPTIFEYTHWLIERFPEDSKVLITSIFMNYSPHCATFNFSDVYEFIDKIDHDLSLKYLEFIVDAFDASENTVFMKLIERYLEKVSDHKEARKLEAILKSADSYEPRTVIRMLDNVLGSETSDGESTLLIKKLKTYPLKALGEHNKALHILFEELSNYTFTAAYCSDVYQEDARAGVVLFNLFFDLVIERSKRNDAGPLTIIRFLEEFGSKLDSAETLAKIPSDLSLKDLQQILAKEIESSSLRKNRVRMEKNLLQVELVNKTSELNDELSKYCIISEEQKCFVCHKTLKGSRDTLVLWFPNLNGRVLTHYNCRKSIESS
ncbi:LAME_0E07382g1_1 [Lachancea meyersii CBS 8951]|uniref:LAME_0E07382g1_1 n=1 Tax=Lachancea meyersii CBS 8951 TaxID=1266667 RepID=A0A1G4JIB3_9SACH|nr:LAME_0E07382g1_1 [Lachancea meyersii CBS 8951]